MSFNLLVRDLKKIIDEISEMKLSDDDLVRLDYDGNLNQYTVHVDIDFNYVISLKGAGADSFGKTEYYRLWDNDTDYTIKNILSHLNDGTTPFEITVYISPRRLEKMGIKCSHNQYKEYVIQDVKVKLEKCLRSKLSDLCTIDVDFSGYIN